MRILALSPIRTMNRICNMAFLRNLGNANRAIRMDRDSLRHAYTSDKSISV